MSSCFSIWQRDRRDFPRCITSNSCCGKTVWGTSGWGLVPCCLFQSWNFSPIFYLFSCISGFVFCWDVGAPWTFSNICTARELCPSLSTHCNSTVSFSFDCRRVTVALSANGREHEALSANGREHELWGVVLEGMFSLGSLLDLLLKTQEVNHTFITNTSLLEQ